MQYHCYQPIRNHVMYDFQGCYCKS